MEIIRFQKVTKQFTDHGETINALKEASFAIHHGEFMAIVGPSGSGKSTLLTLMGALQKPSSGKIYFKGKNLFENTIEQITHLRFHEIGFVLQSSNLVPFLTVQQQLEWIDNLNNKPFNKNKAMTLLSRLGIEHRKDLYPLELSGGERQRAAICRALYQEPELLLADEPTASLDSNRAFEVAELLSSLAKEQQCAVVMVTHDERLLHLCDTVYEMIDGHLILKNS